MATNLRDGLYGLEYREEDRRRVDRENKKSPEIKGLWQRHHEICNLHAQGFKNVEIAEILGIDPQTVSNTVNSIVGEEKISELREIRDGEVKKRMEQIRLLTSKAIGVYNEVFDDPDNSITLKDKVQVANTVLMELSGLRVPTRVQSQSIHTTLSGEELAEFKARGIAAMREAGLIADVPDEPKRLVADEEDEP